MVFQRFSYRNSGARQSRVNCWLSCLFLSNSDVGLLSVSEEPEEFLLRNCVFYIARVASDLSLSAKIIFYFLTPYDGRSVDPTHSPSRALWREFVNSLLEDASKPDDDLTVHVQTCFIRSPSSSERNTDARASAAQPKVLPMADRRSLHHPLHSYCWLALNFV
jgi:hypothetical protein